MNLLKAKVVAVGMKKTGTSPEKVHEWAKAMNQWFEARKKDKK